ncbi:MAG: recombinase [Chloracidobacterium sp. CP2_5A]|nr:MAG: recombinase [Chloracidobacterium sp. CP2_5A]
MQAAALLERIAPPAERRVIIKRDGRAVSWDPERIARAIALAFYAVRHNNAPNPFSDDPAARYGLDEHDYAEALRITGMVVNNVDLRFHRGDNPTVEQVQDIVEIMIAGAGHFDVAKSYVLYRAKKSEARIHKHEENGISDYIAVSKYARYREDLGRRELWPEAVARVFEMHRERFRALLGQPVPELGATVGELIDQAEREVIARRALPSMRSLQFGGKPIEVNNARMYNCCFGHIDHPRRFAEATWLLLSGTGVGFSVQKHHVAKLPPLPLRKSADDLPVAHFTIPDSIEGWADAVDQLIMSYYRGAYVEFDYSKIRPKGSVLRTSGGRAPGHLPLKKALEKMRAVLDQAAGRKLRPIEAYDIIMHAASAVISGGIRRSATIALFSADDDEMTNAKTGEWFVTNPHRQFSNNSAVLVRREASREQFQALFDAIKQFGEPGFYFTENPEYGANPCVEIGLMPALTVDEPTLAKLRALGYDAPLSVGDTVSGWQHCNLSTINGRECRTPEAFYDLCRVASVIGTLQAAYTDLGYLGPVTKVINEREALLGVSICGIMDSPAVLLDPAVLRQGADIAKATNAALARAIGINRAARVTCVKPEGTASLLLGTASGIHPHHAKRYFRRVQAARTEAVYQFFRKHNPHMTEVYGMKADTTDVITFTIEAPEGAITKKDISATKFLEIVKLVQENWVKPGTALEDYNPGLLHNVSNTVVVRPSEWGAVADYIWENRDCFTGISILPASGDKDYPQAPLEEVATSQDIARWNALKYNPVDYSALSEAADYTTFKDVVACAGGQCELA